MASVRSSSSDLNKVIEKWEEAKNNLKIIEEKIDKYKAYINKKMNEKGTDSIDTENYNVSRQRASRTYMSKDRVPTELWNKYSVKTSYDIFRVKKR